MSGPEDKSEGEAEAAGPAAEGGIFASLPRSRPSVRSPRRTAPRRRADSEDAAAPAGEGEHGQATTPRGREQELEALARAGVSLAGDAATLGLKVAGRAAAAVRGAIERR